jgi:hypothetical protein
MLEAVSIGSSLRPSSWACGSLCAIDDGAMLNARETGVSAVPHLWTVRSPDGDLDERAYFDGGVPLCRTYRS